MKFELTPRPYCVDCGTWASTGVHETEVWTIKPDGHWQCDDCWRKEHKDTCTPSDLECIEDEIREYGTLLGQEVEI